MESLERIIYMPAKVTSERVILRKYRHEDAPALCALLRANRARLAFTFRATLNATTTPTKAFRYIQEKLDCWESGSAFYYGVWDPVTRATIGQIQIKHCDLVRRRAELAYFIDQSREGKGLV